MRTFRVFSLISAVLLLSACSFTVKTDVNGDDAAGQGEKATEEQAPADSAAPAEDSSDKAADVSGTEIPANEDAALPDEGADSDAVAAGETSEETAPVVEGEVEVEVEVEANEAVEE